MSHTYTASAPAVVYYIPYKTPHRGWAFRTAIGHIDQIWTEEAAQKIAAINKADDLEEARTGTNIIARAMRIHFEQEGEL